jgi:hypothetical protein
MPGYRLRDFNGGIGLNHAEFLNRSFSNLGPSVPVSVYEPETLNLSEAEIVAAKQRAP